MDSTATWGYKVTVEAWGDKEGPMVTVHGQANTTAEQAKAVQKAVALAIIALGEKK